VGIITPYSAQRSVIIRRLIKVFGEEIKKCVDVNTIDGFQGQEKEVIIFSCVRSNISGQLGFLQDGTDFYCQINY
jgi:senataxin